ncbi:MAG: hypothetical protein NT080_04980 [Spirochaetes bacterium]|nr:hypothetical protein [Spirochaetota bacterium]
MRRLLPALPAGPVFAVAAILSGLAAFAAAAALERSAGAWLDLRGNLLLVAGMEEGLRFSICAAFAAVALRAGRPERALWGVVSAAAFGLAENLSYYLAFPDAAAFLRLLYSQPVHVNAALAFTVALSTRKPVAMAAAVAVAFGYHLAFNAAASLFQAGTIAPAGGIVNAAILMILFALARETVTFQGAFRGQRRT